MNPSTPIFDHDGKGLLCEVVCLLIGRVRSIAPERLGEETAEYRAGGEG